MQKSDNDRNRQPVRIRTDQHLLQLVQIRSSRCSHRSSSRTRSLCLRLLLERRIHVRKEVELPHTERGTGDPKGETRWCG